MPEQIDRIRGIINEHRAIEEQLRQALGAIEDWQITLESSRTRRDQSKIESLSIKRYSLVQAIEHLEEGLRGHYEREEPELAEFAGKVIGEALKVRHQETLGQLSHARELLAGAEFESLDALGLPRTYQNIKKELENAYRFIREQGMEEDVLLRVLLRGVIAQQ